MFVNGIKNEIQNIFHFLEFSFLHKNIKNIIVGAKNKHITMGSSKQTLNVSMFSLIEFPLKKKKTTTNKAPHQSKAIFEICLISSFITTKPKKRDI